MKKSTCANRNYEIWIQPRGGPVRLDPETGEETFPLPMKYKKTGTVEMETKFENDNEALQYPNVAGRVPLEAMQQVWDLLSVFMGFSLLNIKRDSINGLLENNICFFI